MPNDNNARFNELTLSGLARNESGTWARMRAACDKFVEHERRLKANVDVELDEQTGFGYAVRDDRMDLYLYGGIHNIFGIRATDFIKPLSVASDAKLPVRMHINCFGGNVQDAFTIRRQMVDSGVEMDARIEGMCASAATILALTTKHVAIEQGAFFMIHNSSMVTGGTAKELRALADMCEQTDRNLVHMYVEKTGRSEAELAAYMADSREFSGPEAVNLGFCDELLELSSTSVVTNDLEGSRRDSQVQAEVLALYTEAFTSTGGLTT